MAVAYEGLIDEFTGKTEEECYAKNLISKIAAKYGCSERTVRYNRQKYLNSLPDEEVLPTDHEGMIVVGTSTLYSGTEKKLEWVKRSKSKEEQALALKIVVDTLKESIPRYVPEKLLRTDEADENLINQYTLTDYHLGMMAWGEESGANWDLKIAEDVLVKFFELGIKESPNAKTAILAQMGDFLHWDGLDAVTPTSKHVLDADSRFAKLVRVSLRVIRRVIEMLLQKYDNVKVVMAEGNHDPASSVWLSEMFQMYYEDEGRVTIDTNPNPYYCITFGKVCLFYHHGHKKAFRLIESVFVSKFKKEFGNSEFVYGHTGHLHHDKVETNLMTLEQHRTLAAKDAYASRGGFDSGRDAKVITYHKEFGEVGRSVINIKRLI